MTFSYMKKTPQQRIIYVFILKNILFLTLGGLNMLNIPWTLVIQKLRIISHTVFHNNVQIIIGEKKNFETLTISVKLSSNSPYSYSSRMRTTIFRQP